jgi:hypothetical protein
MPRHSTSTQAANRRRQRAIAARLRAETARKAAAAVERRYGAGGPSAASVTVPVTAA